MAYVSIRILIPDKLSFILRLLRSEFQINNGDFIRLHADCIAAMRVYFVEAERPSAMLAQCTAEPLSFMERFSLLWQKIIEYETRGLYVAAKRLLLAAALLGYRFSS